MEERSSAGGGPGRFKQTLYGISIGALAVCLVWLSTSLAAHRGSDESHAGTAGSGSSSPGPTDHASAGATNDVEALRATLISDCHQVFDNQTRPLEAAAVAMGQWEVHIGAMNQLVLGVISLDQATQFWNQTRDGARSHLRAYRAATARLRQPSTLCPAPPSGSGAGPVSSVSKTGKILRCERAVAARFQVLRSAGVALDTWGMHVMHMEMLRTGQMSPHRAEVLWLHSWHEGQKEVVAYHAAIRGARGLHC